MAIHAYWLQNTGPDMMSGVELHYIRDDESTPENQEYWTPSIDWWPSRIRYYAGDKGFGGMTEKLVHANFETIIIHESMTWAFREWRNEKAKDSS